ncbi:MAG TPA: YIP1 family protein [Thermomicrobiales bacterium]|nr:YIP1 family protein [Thermomicrobiales bacterium]
MDYQDQSPTPYQQFPAPTHSFSERIIGALKLERPIFDEVRRDTSAMSQAAIIIAVAGFASGVGAFFSDQNQSFTVDDRTYNVGGSVFTGIIAGIVNIAIALIVWVLISLVYRFVAVRMLGSSETAIQWQEVARPIGFASSASMLSLLSPIPILGGLISFAAGIWAFAAQIVALSETFHVSKWRAFGIIVVSALATVLVIGILGCICVLVIFAIA